MAAGILMQKNHLNDQPSILSMRTSEFFSEKFRKQTDTWLQECGCLKFVLIYCQVHFRHSFFIGAGQSARSNPFM